MKSRMWVFVGVLIIALIYGICSAEEIDVVRENNSQDSNEDVNKVLSRRVIFAEYTMVKIPEAELKEISEKKSILYPFLDDKMIPEILSSRKSRVLLSIACSGIEGEQYLIKNAVEKYLTDSFYDVSDINAGDNKIDNDMTEDEDTEDVEEDFDRGSHNYEQSRPISMFKGMIPESFFSIEAGMNTRLDFGYEDKDENKKDNNLNLYIEKCIVSDSATESKIARLKLPDIEFLSFTGGHNVIIPDGYLQIIHSDIFVDSGVAFRRIGILFTKAIDKIVSVPEDEDSENEQKIFDVHCIGIRVPVSELENLNGRKGAFAYSNADLFEKVIRSSKAEISFTAQAKIVNKESLEINDFKQVFLPEDWTKALTGFIIREPVVIEPLPVFSEPFDIGRRITIQPKFIDKEKSIVEIDFIWSELSGWTAHEGYVDLFDSKIKDYKEFKKIKIETPEISRIHIKSHACCKGDEPVLTAKIFLPGKDEAITDDDSMLFVFTKARLQK